MSKAISLKQELSLLGKEWGEMDPTLRFLDISAILLVIIFGVEYILVNVLDISITVSNGAMMIFPLILAGYVYVLRSKLVNENEDNEKALKEFLLLIGIALVLIASTVIYSLLLNNVLLN